MCEEYLVVVMPECGAAPHLRDDSHYYDGQKARRHRICDERNQLEAQAQRAVEGRPAAKSDLSFLSQIKDRRL